MRIVSFNANQEELAKARTFLAQSRPAQGVHKDGTTIQPGDEIFHFILELKKATDEVLDGTLELFVRNPEEGETPYVDIEDYDGKGNLRGSFTALEINDHYEIKITSGSVIHHIVAVLDTSFFNHSKDSNQLPHGLIESDFDLILELARVALENSNIYKHIADRMDVTDEEWDSIKEKLNNHAQAVNV